MGCEAIKSSAPRKQILIPTLHIKKLEPGFYRAELRDTSFGKGEFETQSIAEAIRHTAAGAPKEVLGFHIWYEHVSIGTTPVMNMRYDPETLSQRLMTLHSQMR